MRKLYKRTPKKQINIEDRMRVLANAMIDRILEMTPEERKVLDKKIKENEANEKTKID